MYTKEELDKLYRGMAEWDAFVRRHNANIFDVMFKDVDNSLSESELSQIISDVALFFKLSLPTVNSHCNTLAKMLIDRSNASNCELFYNWEMLSKAGINNRDAFTLCMVHELAHLYLKDRRFMLCINERWCHEIAADYIVGLYSSDYQHSNTQMYATLTHPQGIHRAEVVEFARETIDKIPDREIDTLMFALPVFVYGRLKQLNQELAECIARLGNDDESHSEYEEYKMPDNIEDWPDSNLVKQLVLKYNKQNKE